MSKDVCPSEGLGYRHITGFPWRILCITKLKCQAGVHDSQGHEGSTPNLRAGSVRIMAFASVLTTIWMTATPSVLDQWQDLRGCLGDQVTLRTGRSSVTTS